MYGVEEELLPALVAVLDEARACALLRGLHAEIGRGQVGQVFRQFANLGAGVLRAYFNEPDGGPPISPRGPDRKQRAGSVNQEGR